MTTNNNYITRQEIHNHKVHNHSHDCHVCPIRGYQYQRLIENSAMRNIELQSIKHLLLSVIRPNWPCEDKYFHLPKIQATIARTPATANVSTGHPLNPPNHITLLPQVIRVGVWQKYNFVYYPYVQNSQEQNKKITRVVGVRVADKNMHTIKWT